MTRVTLTFDLEMVHDTLSPHGMFICATYEYNTWNTQQATELTRHVGQTDRGSETNISPTPTPPPKPHHSHPTHPSKNLINQSLTYLPHLMPSVQCFLILDIEVGKHLIAVVAYCAALWIVQDAVVFNQHHIIVEVRPVLKPATLESKQYYSRTS